MRGWFSWRGAAAGCVAGLALVGTLVAGVLTRGEAVLAGALAERARGLLPLQVLGLFIVRFKFAAKPIGFWFTMGSVVVACAVLGGLWAGRSRLRPLALALGTAATVAAVLVVVAGPPSMMYLSARLDAEGVERPGALAQRTIASAIAVDALATGAVFAAILALLGRRSSPAARGGARRRAAEPVGLRAGETGASGEVSRREFLARSAIVAGALTGATALVQWMGRASARAAATAQSLFQRIKGLPPEVTPTDKFYVVSKNTFGLDPKVDEKKWRLEVGGLVGAPVKLTYDDIRAMTPVSRYHTLECISNEVGGDLISNAMWKGVRFRDIIARAGGVSPTAIRFAFRCADGYTEGIAVADAMAPDTMLAYEINGTPLPPAHGFPLRLLIPGLFGMKNPKWITKIEAVSTNFTGYWEASGWSDEAIVKTTSIIRVPVGDQALPLGEVELGGMAYAGDRGIKEVEISADGGKTWTKAERKQPLGRYTWVLWAAVWKPTGPGEYTLKVRALDGSGIMQTSSEAPTLPDGASGYHAIRVRISK